MALRCIDLMVGDWVRIVDDDTDEIYETKVAGISGNLGNIYAPIPEYGETAYPFGEDCVEPIPLTPEILEKNGFYFGNTTNEEDFCSSTGAGLPGEGWCWDEGGGEVKIIFPIGSDGGLVRLDAGFFDKYLEFVFANPICVHHLQHLLRLCGIDKDIEL